MPGNRPVRRDGGHLAQHFKPADDAAVDYGDAVYEEQVGEPEGSRLLVKYRQIVVGVSRSVGANGQAPPAQIDVELIRDENGRGHNFDALRLLTKRALKFPEIVFATLGQRAGQFRMTDKFRMIATKCGCAENVVGM